LGLRSMLGAGRGEGRAEPSAGGMGVRAVVPDHRNSEAGDRNGRLEGVDAIRVASDQPCRGKRDEIAARHNLDEVRERRDREGDVPRETYRGQGFVCRPGEALTLWRDRDVPGRDEAIDGHGGADQRALSSDADVTLSQNVDGS
jgi:hypothetical protein